MIDAILEPIAEPSYSFDVYGDATPNVLSSLRRKNFDTTSANITDLTVHRFDDLPFETEWTDANHFLCLWVNRRPSVYAGWIYNDQVVPKKMAAWITTLQGIACHVSIARHEKPFPPRYWAAGLVRCVEELSVLATAAESAQNTLRAIAITPASENFWFTTRTANVSVEKKQANMRRFYDATALALGYNLIRAGKRSYINCDIEEMSQPPKIENVYVKELIQKTDGISI